MHKLRRDFMNLRRRDLNSVSDVYTAHVRINLLNFCDPFYNVADWDRAEMEAALQKLAKSRVVTKDGHGGWMLAPPHAKPAKKKRHAIHRKNFGRRRR